MSIPDIKIYEPLRKSLSHAQWDRIGIARRAGVATPLFSIYSAQSVGIGEIPDIQLLVDWCRKTGVSIIQLLPLNDVGFDFAPYDAKSTIALEPMYLSLNQVKGIKTGPFKTEIEDLKRRFPTGGERVNYGIKKAKLEILSKMFEQVFTKLPWGFKKFVSENQFWIHDYALFKVLKEVNGETSWQSWPAPARAKEPMFLEEVRQKHSKRFLFHQWLQWQIFEQFQKVRKYAASKNVLLMGDLPFLVSRDSADVWAHQDYFKMHLSSGAPPDMYFATGQRWGMPPYDWPKIEARGYDYVIHKLKYAEKFYDLFRIDHVVGMFRVWTIRLDEPAETGGLKGVFDPEPIEQWEEHGWKILSVMIQSTKMLPCAEDLGVVPECSDRVLSEFGIPGTNVQRWLKNWNTDYDFKPGADYRINSMAAISTHDSSSLIGWWEFEVGTVDGELFKRKCHEKGIPFDVVLPKLFDLSASHFGRLRWREDLRDGQQLLGVLERSHQEAGDLVDLYLGSFAEKKKFWAYAGLNPESFQEKPTPELIQAALSRSNEAASIFSLQLLQDWLSLAEIPEDTWQYRINFPGTSGPQNWSLVSKYSLETMNQLECNAKIFQLNRQSGRTN